MRKDYPHIQALMPRTAHKHFKMVAIQLGYSDLVKFFEKLGKLSLEEFKKILEKK